MLTQRGKRLIEIAVEYALTELELVDIIEKCICDYYKITSEELKSKVRKRPLTQARRMYLMLTINTVSLHYCMLARNINQSHCMVCHAKNLLIELDENRKWNERALQDYEGINANIITTIIATKIKPKSIEEDNFLRELAETMESLRISSENNLPKEKLLDIMNLIFIAEKDGQHDKVVDALKGVILNSNTSIVGSEVEFFLSEELQSI